LRIVIEIPQQKLLGIANGIALHEVNSQRNQNGISLYDTSV